MTIEGQPGKSYKFDGIPAIVVVSSPERGLIVGTHGAVAASLRAASTGESIEKDESFSAVLAHVTPDTSKAVLVDVGRAVSLAATLSQGNNARELQLIGQLTKDMRVSLVTDEGPNRLVIRAEVSGLPKYRDVLPLIRHGTAPRRVTKLVD